jgi:hypothetical protein
MKATGLNLKDTDYEEIVSAASDETKYKEWPLEAGL